VFQFYKLILYFIITKKKEDRGGRDFTYMGSSHPFIDFFYPQSAVIFPLPDKGLG
jgi:hypothetical protein